MAKAQKPKEPAPKKAAPKKKAGPSRDVEIVKACMGADVMMGHDPDCARWIKRFREAPALQAGGGAAVPAQGAARGRREGGHRRRAQGPA